MPAALAARGVADPISPEEQLAEVAGFSHEALDVGSPDPPIRQHVFEIRHHVGLAQRRQIRETVLSDVDARKAPVVRANAALRARGAAATALPAAPARRPRRQTIAASVDKAWRPVGENSACVTAWSIHARQAWHCGCIGVSRFLTPSQASALSVCGAPRRAQATLAHAGRTSAGSSQTSNTLRRSSIDECVPPVETCLAANEAAPD